MRGGDAVTDYGGSGSVTKAAVLDFPSDEPLQVFRNGSLVSLTPKVQAIIEMIVEQGEAVEAIAQAS